MIRVRVCMCVRVCALEPHISAFLFFALLAAAAMCYACLVMMYACMRCLYAPSAYSHGTTAINRTASLCGSLSLCAFWHCIYMCMCDVCAMIRKLWHVLLLLNSATFCCTSIIMFNVNSIVMSRIAVRV